jgi:hypothetical protein
VADETTVARRGGGGARTLLAWVVILGLIGLVVWLVAERNARTWYLVPDEGRLVVMRGMKLPVGRQPFKTDDPALAQVYEPIVVPPGAPVPPEQGFDERSALDQALYDLVAKWARDDIASGDPAPDRPRGDPGGAPEGASTTAACSASEAATAALKRSAGEVARTGG